MGPKRLFGHPFIDGNKRIGHAAVEVVLVLNGFELVETVDEQETMIGAVASDKLTREAFARWLQTRLRPVETPA